jgi:hypothetical protein
MLSSGTLPLQETPSPWQPFLYQTLYPGAPSADLPIEVKETLSLRAAETVSAFADIPENGKFLVTGNLTIVFPKNLFSRIVYSALNLDPYKDSINLTTSVRRFSRLLDASSHEKGFYAVSEQTRLTAIMKFNKLVNDTNDSLPEDQQIPNIKGIYIQGTARPSALSEPRKISEESGSPSGKASSASSFNETDRLMPPPVRVSKGILLSPSSRDSSPKDEGISIIPPFPPKPSSIRGISPDKAPSVETTSSESSSPQHSSPEHSQDSQKLSGSPPDINHLGIALPATPPQNPVIFA